MLFYISVPIGHTLDAIGLVLAHGICAVVHTPSEYLALVSLSVADIRSRNAMTTESSGGALLYPYLFHSTANSKCNHFFRFGLEHMDLL